MDFRNEANEMTWASTMAVMTNSIFNLTSQLEQEKKINAEKNLQIQALTQKYETEILQLKRKIEEMTPIVPLAVINFEATSKKGTYDSGYLHKCYRHVIDKFNLRTDENSTPKDVSISLSNRSQAAREALRLCQFKEINDEMVKSTRTKLRNIMAQDTYYTSNRTAINQKRKNSSRPVTVFLERTPDKKFSQIRFNPIKL